MVDSIVIFLISVIIIVFFVLFLYLRHEVLEPGEKAAAKATRGILSRFGLLRGFKTLSNVVVKDNGGDVVIENMLIGYFGILLVRTLGARGEYYGTLDGEHWTLTAKDKKQILENPVKHLDREAAALRTALSKSKIYNIPIERIVYLSNKSRKTALYVTHNGEILLSGKLAGYLQKTKFEKDIGLDVKKIEDAVSGVHAV